MTKQSTALIVGALSFLLPAVASAQLPEPTYGWNLGNTLEPPDGEGTWNNPAATQALIDTVVAAGFNTIRIPVAWDSHANADMDIDPDWLDRVQMVVDYCLAHDGVHVIINSHWDNGWLDENIRAKVNSTIDDKVYAYWSQIADHFSGYDDHLLFACTNEPIVDRSNQMSTLLTYEQTFVDAVRSSDGYNNSRWLVVQGPNTDIDTTYDLMNAVPVDPSGNLMVEVHYYSPYQFTLMTADEWWGNQFYFWGSAYHSTTLPDYNPTWGEEDYLLGQFQKMKAKFIDQGIPVILGEFGAIKRSDNPALLAADYELHVASRTYFFKSIVDTANALGLKPIYWDNGDPGEFALFDRNTYELVDADATLALTGGPALPPPDGGPYCGDSSCNGAETCLSCEADCGACPPSVCGDGICDATEGCASCSADCGNCCGQKGDSCSANGDCCTNICRPSGHCG